MYFLWSATEQTHELLMHAEVTVSRNKFKKLLISQNFGQKMATRKKDSSQFRNAQEIFKNENI